MREPQFPLTLNCMQTPSLLRSSIRLGSIVPQVPVSSNSDSMSKAVPYTLSAKKAYNNWDQLSYDNGVLRAEYFAQMLADPSMLDFDLICSDDPSELSEEELINENNFLKSLLAQPSDLAVNASSTETFSKGIQNMQEGISCQNLTIREPMRTASTKQVVGANFTPVVQERSMFKSPACNSRVPIHSVTGPSTEARLTTNNMAQSPAFHGYAVPMQPVDVTNSFPGYCGQLSAKTATFHTPEYFSNPKVSPATQRLREHFLSLRKLTEDLYSDYICLYVQKETKGYLPPDYSLFPEPGIFLVNNDKIQPGVETDHLLQVCKEQLESLIIENRHLQTLMNGPILSTESKDVKNSSNICEAVLPFPDDVILPLSHSSQWSDLVAMPAVSTVAAGTEAVSCSEIHAICTKDAKAKEPSVPTESQAVFLELPEIKDKINDVLGNSDALIKVQHQDKVETSISCFSPNLPTPCWSISSTDVFNVTSKSNSATYSPLVNCTLETLPLIQVASTSLPLNESMPTIESPSIVLLHDETSLPLNESMPTIAPQPMLLPQDRTTLLHNAISRRLTEESVLSQVPLFSPSAESFVANASPALKGLETVHLNDLSATAKILVYTECVKPSPGTFELVLQEMQVPVRPRPDEFLLDQLFSQSPSFQMLTTEKVRCVPEDLGCGPITETPNNLEKTFKDSSFLLLSALPMLYFCFCPGQSTVFLFLYWSSQVQERRMLSLLCYLPRWAIRLFSWLHLLFHTVCPSKWFGPVWEGGILLWLRHLTTWWRSRQTIWAPNYCVPGYSARYPVILIISKLLLKTITFALTTSPTMHQSTFRHFQLHISRTTIPRIPQALLSFHFPRPREGGTLLAGVQLQVQPISQFQPWVFLCEIQYLSSKLQEHTVLALSVFPDPPALNLGFPVDSCFQSLSCVIAEALFPVFQPFASLCSSALLLAKCLLFYQY